tara:strand:- start:688 stop:1596 length:909 start_codon:yes stop_codon:yes gene_type:complete
MKVSILIVTYQSEDEILDCIKSIHQNVNNIVFEIIIIDNASTDKTIKTIKDNFPDITIIKNKQNKGFSFANNLGAKLAKGEFLFFLNPDSLILENTIEKLMGILDMDKNIGIIGPAIKNINGSFQSPALKIPNVLITLFEAFGLYLFLPNTVLGYRSHSNIDIDLDVGWVTGACFMIKREDYDLLNGFDENYFLYLEDADLCIRMNSYLGKKIRYTRRTSVIHFKAKSSKNDSYVSKLSSYRSKLYYHKKHDGYLTYLALFPVLYLSVFLKLICLVFLMRGKEQIMSQFKVLYKIFSADRII